MPEDGLGNESKMNGERELLAAVVRRDRSAFAELYRIYQPRLYGYIRRFVASAVLVEETVDDVMFVVWTDARKFRGKSAVSSWIFGIAYRKALTTLRREGRYEAPLRRDVETADPSGGPRADIELIHAGLAELSPDHATHQRRPFLRFFAGSGLAAGGAWESGGGSECPGEDVSGILGELESLLEDVGICWLEGFDSGWSAQASCWGSGSWVHCSAASCW